MTRPLTKNEGANRAETFDTMDLDCTCPTGDIDLSTRPFIRAAQRLDADRAIEQARETATAIRKVNEYNRQFFKELAKGG